MQTHTRASVVLPSKNDPTIEQQDTENFSPKHEQSAARTGSGRQTYIVVVDEGEIEDEDDEVDKWQDRSKRLLFVRKVLATVGFQLLVCTCAMIAGLTIEPLHQFSRSEAGGFLGLVCLIVWFCLFIPIQCCGLGYGKPNATNISLLLISTVLLSIFATSTVAHYDVREIVVAAAATVGTVFVLAVITFHTKFDITGIMIYILGAFLALFMFWMIMAILIITGVIPVTGENQRILPICLSCLFVVMLAVMILYDLQLIVGKGRVKYTENDWLRASISLFYDIILFFMTVLGLQRH